jgi:predicted ArsR family transcriptional regulator
MPAADDRFWATTRGRLLVLLRRGSETVAELAAALGLTDNAVRSHLTALERDGLLRPTGIRRGPRRPTVTYALTAEAEHLFPKEYGAVLRHLLDELKDRLAPDQLDDLARATGHRFARDFARVGPPPGRKDRVERAVGVLRELGGCCEFEGANGTVVLGCSVCPLAAAADGHPEVCRLVETMLGDVLGVPVRQRCQGDPPRCRFEFDRAAAPDGKEPARPPRPPTRPVK